MATATTAAWAAWAAWTSKSTSLSSTRFIRKGGASAPPFCVLWAGSPNCGFWEENRRVVAKCTDMKTSLRRLVLVLAVLALAVPAGAQEAVEPEFLRSEAWVHATDVPVTNIEASQGTFPSWDDTKPTASHPYGAGGAYVANNYDLFTTGMVTGRQHDPAGHFTMQGEFTGELDTMGVTLYAHLPAGAVCTDFNLAFDLQIDGESILYQEQSSPSAGLMTTPVEDTLFSVHFAFTRLHEAMTLYGLETGPDVTHDIYLNAANFYACNEMVWVYDSAEAPAGIVFNVADKELRRYTNVDVFNPPPPLAE